MLTITRRARPIGVAALMLTAIAGAPRAAAAQWATTYETFYLQAPHNWVFRNEYQAADRLFNAFDYGHAILYETLWTKPDARASVLEDKEYDYLTKKVLVRPPRVPLSETPIEVAYSKLAPEAKAMFDWSHILHRQIYDVLADERLDQAAKDREVERLIAYYKTRTDLAFSSRPKSMVLMQEQPYSLAFRKKYPKFNGLIWGYHWMQVGLYEPLMVGHNSAERQAGVRATVARFWQMLENPPKTLPHQMPMTAAVAPTFAKRYPEAAIIFDNLHSMHDVVSDILANPNVPKNRKGAEIALAARRYRDDTTLVMASTEAWRTMAQEMGIENMGGPPVGFVPALPTPTVTYGAVMHHDDRTGRMVSVLYGEMLGGHNMAGMAAMPGMAGVQHGDSARTGAAGGMAGMPGMTSGQTGAPAAAPSSDHAGHAGMPNTPNVPAMPNMPGMANQTAASGMASMPGMSGMAGMSDSGHMAAAMALHERMMADPVIQKRVMADPEMRRLMDGMMRTMPGEHGAHAESMKDMPGMHAMPGTMHTAPTTNGAARRGTTKPSTKPSTTSAPKKPAGAKKPAAHTMPGMPGMKMP